MALLISTNEHLRLNMSNASDAMFFTFAKNGQFTVKMAYQLLRGVRGDGRDKKLWGWLWKKAKLIPKLRIFVWRGMQGALPVRAVLAVRIHQIDPTCPFCGSQPETIMHALFKCDFPRAVWLVSDLGMRTENLPDSFPAFLHSVWDTLSDGQSSYLVTLMWAIWKSRNEALFNHKRQSMQSCKAFHKVAHESCWNAMLSTFADTPSPTGTGQDYQIQVSNVNIYVDGSWDQAGRAGIGVYLMENGLLVRWISKAVQALTSAQAEAMAILEGVKMLNELAKGDGTVFSDSRDTVKAVQASTLNISDWRAFSEIWQAWKLRADSKGKCTLCYCNREDEMLKFAHKLANQGRIYGWEKTGCNFNEFSIEEIE